MKGRTLGRYRIVELLGEGGMGSVWRAEDALLGRSVALKLLSRHLVDSDSARQRFLREARAAGALDHPGIGTVYDTGEQDGDVFIAMRLVDGGTVSGLLASSGALPILDAVRIAAAAADALGHAHARGILHRDVSARNLMLTKDGQVVVVDFGLARTADETRLTQSGAAVGTAHYMAPEIALGEPADRRSDVYSLGAVFYEMLTAAPPFQGERLEAIVYAAVHQPAVPPSEKRPGISAELDRIVLKALAKKPQDRYATMEALRSELEALERSGLIAEGAATAIASLRQAPVPRRWTFPSRGVAVACAVVALLGVAGVWIGQTRRFTSQMTRYKSLAVLPFKNAGPSSEENAYLSDGLSQTLINKFTQISDLRVPPWNSVSRFRDMSAGARDLAAKLRVDALLVGTIHQDGQRIRGTVSIMDGKSGLKVWANEFDEPLAELFAIQNRIAVATATKVLGKLSGKQSEALSVPAAASIEAYEHYLKGTLALQKTTEAGDEEALGLFQRAIGRDPCYAHAWVGVGVVQSDRFAYGWNGGSKELQTAQDAYRKALECDPSSIPARRGLIRNYWTRGQSEECLKQGKQVALSAASGTDAKLARAEAYAFGGQADRGLALFREVMEEDPANPSAPWLVTTVAGWAEHYEESVEVGRKYLASFGDDPEVQFHVAISLELLGRSTEAESHYRRAIETEPTGRGESKLAFARFLRNSGRLDEADRLTVELIDTLEDKISRRPDNCWIRNLLGAAYGSVGDITRMREDEERVIRDCGAGMLRSLIDFEALSGNKERYVALSRAALRAGNVDNCGVGSHSDVPPSMVESWPGYKEFAAERDAECKRLAALY